MIEAVASAQQSAALAGAAPEAASRQGPATAASSGSDTFHSVLSALNPLQYLPVVGTIYRAATGDEIAEPVRRIGSAIGSFLMGGPIGLALNLASLGAEKVLGFDFDKMAQGIMTTFASGLGVGGGSEADPASATASAGTASPGATLGTATAWTPAQLSAYGVSVRADGDLASGDLTGADVLNALEISRFERIKLAATPTLSLSA